MYNINSFEKIGKEFKVLLKAAQEIDAQNSEQRNILLNSVYTIQQSIDAALDGLPAGRSNTARTLNGDDLIAEEKNKIKVIGSIKTSSKDRLDKIFVDKFLYNRLTATLTPYITVFLNDVQRNNTRRENSYGINATFFPAIL